MKARFAPSAAALVTGALAILSAGATAAAGAGCPRGTLAVKRPRGCIPVALVTGALAPRAGLRAHASDLTADLLYPRAHVRPPARDRALDAAILTDLGASFPRLLRADANGPPYPSGPLPARDGLAHTAGASITQSISGPGGFTATGGGQVIDAPPGQVGQVISVAIDAAVERTGLKATLGQEIKLGAYADACPDRNGEVDGRGVGHSALAIAVPQGLSIDKHAAAGASSIDATITFHGRVGDDGKLIDYSLDYEANGSYDGPSPGLFGIGHFDAHFRAHMHMAFDHLRVGVPIDDAQFDREFQNYQTSGFGPAGVLSGAYKHMVDSLATFAWIAKHDADEALSQAQRNWYDDAACVKATFDPASLKDVQPGSTHDVQVTVKDARDDEPVALDATLYSPQGSVTPTKATTGADPTHASLTITDKPGQDTDLRVTGVSKRGRLDATFTATQLQLYDASVTGTQTTTWSESDSATQNCGGSNGSGTDKLSFATQTPTRVQAIGNPDGSITLSAVAAAAQLADGGVHVPLAGSTEARQGTFTVIPAAMSCPIAVGGGGGGTPPPSDCGTKPSPNLFADLAYDGTTMLTLWNDPHDPVNLSGGVAGSQFSNCPYFDTFGNVYSQSIAKGTGPLAAATLAKGGVITIAGSGSASNSENTTTDEGKGVTDTAGEISDTEVSWTITLTPVTQ